MRTVQKNQRVALKARPRKVNEAEFERVVNEVSDRCGKTLEYLAR